MKGRRPWKVHVRSIGPNFSFASEERACALAARLVSGETWDGGSKGLLGSYATVEVYRSLVAGRDVDPEVLLRRSVYRADGTVTEEIFPTGGAGWVTQEKATC